MMVVLFFPHKRPKQHKSQPSQQWNNDLVMICGSQFSARNTHLVQNTARLQILWVSQFIKYIQMAYPCHSIFVKGEIPRNGSKFLGAELLD